MSAKNERWLVMVYLSGDNNLSSEMVWAITEIGAAFAGHGGKSSLTDNVAITIQYDTVMEFSETLRYALPNRDRDLSLQRSAAIPLAAYLTRKVPAENAADPAVLADFISFSVREFSDYPNRMLILSGHGSGAVGDFLTDDNANQRQPGSLTIPHLRRAFELAAQRLRMPEGPLRPKDRLIHVLGMDSCLMSTAEVCDEVSGCVDYVVASEGFVPNAGWPYRHLLDRLKERIDKAESLDAESVSSYLVDDIADYYSEYLPAGLSLDIAASRLSGMPQLKKAVQKLTAVLTGAEEAESALANQDVKNRVILAHWWSQSFKFEQYTDLADFCHELAGEKNDKIAAACKSVERHIGRLVVQSRTVGIDFQHAHGLSVFFPWRPPAFPEDDTLIAYRQLRFSDGDTGWADFVDEYVKQTMRPAKKLPKKAGMIVKDIESLLATPSAASGKHAGTGNKHAGTGNKHAGTGNKHAGTGNKFAQMAELLGGVFPWSMKNPPQTAEVYERAPESHRSEARRYPAPVDRAEAAHRARRPRMRRTVVRKAGKGRTGRPPKR